MEPINTRPTHDKKTCGSKKHKIDTENQKELHRELEPEQNLILDENLVRKW